MNSAVETPTLRDDWQARRAVVAGAPGEHPFADVQLRVLEFLLKRYGDSPDADRPAQFPLPSAVYVNQRAVLVHHHLGRHVASGVKSPREAQERMAAILHRMADEADGASDADAPFPAEPADVREARRLRFLLADPSQTVRMRTIFVLGEVGTLDDVGLLMDLLALPESPDEIRDERQLLISAIEKISGTQPRSEKEGWQWLWQSLSDPDAGLSGEPTDLRPDRMPPATFGIQLPRPAAARWSGLQGLILSSSLTIGVAVVLTIVVGLALGEPSPTTIYSSAAMLAIYCCGVGMALYWWERTRRRRGW